MPKTKKQRGGHVFYKESIENDVLQKVLLPYFGQSHIKKTFLARGGFGGVYVYKNDSPHIGLRSPFQDDLGNEVNTLAVKVEFKFKKSASNRETVKYLNIYDAGIKTYQVQICPSILFAGLVREKDRDLFFPPELNGEQAGEQVSSVKPFIPPGAIYVTIMEPMKPWHKQYFLAKDLSEDDKYSHLLPTFRYPLEIGDGLLTQEDITYLNKIQPTLESITEGEEVISSFLSLLFLLATLGYTHGDPSYENVLKMDIPYKGGVVHQAILIDFLETGKLSKFQQKDALYIYDQVLIKEGDPGWDPDWIKFDFTRLKEREKKIKELLLEMFKWNLDEEIDNYKWMDSLLVHGFGPILRRKVPVDVSGIYGYKTYEASCDRSTDKPDELLNKCEEDKLKKRATEEKLAAEKLAAEKLAAEKLAAEKLAAEKLAAEKLAADQLAADQLALRVPEQVPKQSWKEWLSDIGKHSKYNLGGKRSKKKRRRTALKLKIPILKKQSKRVDYGRNRLLYGGAP